MPHLKKKVQALHKEGKCKPSVEQHAVLVCGVWYGWLDADFRAHVRSKYPWLLLLFVPPSCTHLFQPADCGIIRAFKAAILRLYEEWAMAQVLEQLKNGTDPSKVTLPHDAPTMKGLMAGWVGRATLMVQSGTVVPSWRHTGLLAAWDPARQRKAWLRVQVVCMHTPTSTHAPMCAMPPKKLPCTCASTP